MNKILKSSLIPLSLSFIMTACSGKNDSNNSKSHLVPSKLVAQDSVNSEVSVEEQLQTQLRKVNQHPTLTIVLMPKADNQKSIQKLVKGGAKLIYDPNNGLGSTIPFYIAELTPDQINDTAFLKGLNLKAASIDSAGSAASPIDAQMVSN
jgi:hypothetical protein